MHSNLFGTAQFDPFGQDHGPRSHKHPGTTTNRIQDFYYTYSQKLYQSQPIPLDVEYLTRRLHLDVCFFQAFNRRFSIGTADEDFFQEIVGEWVDFIGED